MENLLFYNRAEKEISLQEEIFEKDTYGQFNNFETSLEKVSGDPTTTKYNNVNGGWLERRKKF